MSHRYPQVAPGLWRTAARAPKLKAPLGEGLTVIAAPRIVVAGLLAALLLAACTDDPEPRFAEPSPSPSASESTSPAVDEKEPWERKSKAGAVAFAKHWIDVFNEAQMSGDTSTFAASNTERCVSCRDLTEQLKEIYDDGGSLRSEGWRVIDLVPRPGSLLSDTEVVLRIDRSPQRIVDGDGRVQRFPGGEATFSMGVTWAKDRWLVDELVRL